MAPFPRWRAHQRRSTWKHTKPRGTMLTWNASVISVIQSAILTSVGNLGSKSAGTDIVLVPLSGLCWALCARRREKLDTCLIVLLLTGGWNEAGSISRSDLLAVKYGGSQRQCVVLHTAHLKERQTARLRVWRNFKQKVRWILCFKTKDGE